MHSLSCIRATPPIRRDRCPPHRRPHQQPPPPVSTSTRIIRTRSNRTTRTNQIHNLPTTTENMHSHRLLRTSGTTFPRLSDHQHSHNKPRLRQRQCQHLMPQLSQPEHQFSSRSSIRSTRSIQFLDRSCPPSASIRHVRTSTRISLIRTLTLPSRIGRSMCCRSHSIWRRSTTSTPTWVIAATSSWQLAAEWLLAAAEVAQVVAMAQPVSALVSGPVTERASVQLVWLAVLA